MAKKKRVRKPADYSLSHLQQVVEGKQSQLADLKAKRAELQKKLDELDTLIRETEGTEKSAATPATTKRKARTKKRKKTAVKKRAKNTKTAKECAIEVLAKEKKGLPLKELANRILAGGYKSNSANFSVPLYQVLHNERSKGETFDVDDRTGNWILRK